jgi:hypothetical protein
MTARSVTQLGARRVSRLQSGQVATWSTLAADIDSCLSCVLARHCLMPVTGLVTLREASTSLRD